MQAYILFQIYLSSVYLGGFDTSRQLDLPYGTYSSSGINTPRMTFTPLRFLLSRYRIASSLVNR